MNNMTKSMKLLQMIAYKSSVPLDRFVEGNLTAYEWFSLTTTIPRLIESKEITKKQFQNAWNTVQKRRERIEEGIKKIEAKRRLHACADCKHGTCNKKRNISYGTCLMGHVKCSTYEICDQEYHEST